MGAKRIISHHTRLFDAMKELRRHRSGSRCIFEVKNKKLVSDPHKIAGFAQIPRNGFNKYWNDWYDIRRMHRIAALWYADKHKPNPRVNGKFIVVVNDKVVRLYHRLKPAMLELRNHHTKLSRCIFEVKGHKVNGNPRTIAGYKQRQENGFDKYWNDENDIKRMRQIARVWYARMKLPGKYIAVANNRAQIFHRLHKAQEVLQRTTKGNRCIFEAKNGKVVRNANKIAGIRQIPDNFFNVKWGDVRKLRRIAFLKYARRYIKVKNVNGPFIVVTNTVPKKYGKLQAAMNALRHSNKFSRCIFAVEKNAVVRNPRTIKGYSQKPEMGFDAYWNDSSDVTRMYRIAKQWWEERKKPKVENKRGTFVVIVKNVVIGKYNKLFAAQRALKMYKPENRAVFEVKNGVVQNPNKIAGYPQTERYGFDKKWKNKAELKDLIKWAKILSKIFVLVHGDQAVGFFTKKKHARARLQRYSKKSKKPRAVFLIHFGEVSHVKMSGERWKKGQKRRLMKIAKDAFERRHGRRMMQLRRE